jgi:hypothetical protein
VDNLQEKIDFTMEDTLVEAVETALEEISFESVEATSAQTESEVVETITDMKEKDDKAKAAKKYKMAGHDDDKDKMAGHDEDEDEEDMAKDKDDDDEKEGYKKDKDKYSAISETESIVESTNSIEIATSNEDDNDAEEAKENSDASFTESEKQELARFRRQEKEKILESYKQFLSQTVYVEFTETLDTFSKDGLERELKIKVADYFMAQATEIAKAKELESKKEFKTLQVISQLRDKDVASDIAKLVDKYKK